MSVYETLAGPIGSIATAWAFRDVSGNNLVATKDIDLVLRPAVTAVATAQTLGTELLAHGWQPQFTHGRNPGDSETLADDLPVLRLSPPDESNGWFVELLADPPPGQIQRKQWRRFKTAVGDFGLPSFRYMPVAMHGASETPQGLLVAQPACMALAHLLEHADPDRTPISNLQGLPPRFTKDVGRAVALWWLAGQQSTRAGESWTQQWNEAMSSLYPGQRSDTLSAARKGLDSIFDYLRESHQIALTGVLAPHGTTLAAWSRAHAGLIEFIDTNR